MVFESKITATQIADNDSTEHNSNQQQRSQRATNNPCYNLSSYGQALLNSWAQPRFNTAYLKGNFILGQAPRVFAADGQGTDRIIKEAAKLAMDKNNPTAMCQWRFGSHYALMMLNPNDIQNLLTNHQDAYENYDSTGSFELFFGKGTIFSLPEGTETQKALRSRFLSTLFSDKALHAGIQPMQAVVTKYLSTIHKSKDEHKRFDVSFLSNCIAMDMIGQKLGLLDVPVDIKSELLNRLHQGAKTVATHRGQTVKRFLPFLNYPPFNSCYQSSIERIVAEAIVYMKERVLPRNEANILGTINWLNQDGTLTRTELYQDRNVQRIIEFYVAGSETSATLLQFSLMLLADPKHKTILEKVRAEISEQTIPPEQWTYDTVKNLHYLHLVQQEVLRLYPPIPDIVFSFSRSVDLEVGRLNKGDMVLISPRFAHRLTTIWGEDAAEFRPERFEEDLYQHNHLKKYAYFPFGFDPRSCPGQRSAKLAMLLSLARIINTFDIHFDHSDTDTQHPFETYQLFTLRSAVIHRDLCFSPLQDIPNDEDGAELRNYSLS